jgi:transposase
MVKININERDIPLFRYYRYNHPHPKVQVRMEALLLKSQGLPHYKIENLAGISNSTLRRYLCMYIDGGIEELKKINYVGPKSELLEHEETIEGHFRKYPPKSIKEAIAVIEELTGIKRKPTQVRKFLKSIGMELRKVGMIPSKADPEEQELFKKEKLEPRLDQAKEGKRVVFFVDAAHFVLAPFLGMLWCFTRVFIKAPAGRQRFNVLGAINAITHELITVTNDKYINALSFCDLLRCIDQLNLTVPITLVLDNARYQKCQIVWELAQSLNIELLYLPSYSPNLNLIERLWKFVKKECLYSIYYSNFTEFKNAITDVLDQTHTTYKKELDSLLTLKFQTFQKVQLASERN